MTKPDDIVRAATIGRRAPIGRIRYAAERITAVLDRGADPSVNLLAVRTILEGAADELEAAAAVPLPIRPDDPRPCTWPACLSEADQQLLADDVGKGMLGEATVPMPDPRPGCGCVDGSPEDLTRAELQTLVDDQGLDLYRARDVLAFVAEMCDLNDAGGTPITTADVRDWLGYTGCGGVIVLPDEAVAKLATMSGESPDKAATSDNGPDIAGEQP